MDAERIVKLTPDAIRELLDSRRVPTITKTTGEDPARRREERWPFPGTVEVWLPDGCYGEKHMLATMHNLSPNGLAMRTRRPIPAETKISLAIHEPELSCYGEAVVRHCSTGPVGYLIGVEFAYPDEVKKNGVNGSNGKAH